MKRVKHLVLALPVVALSLSGCSMGSDSTAPQTHGSHATAEPGKSASSNDESADQIWSKTKTRLNNYSWLAMRGTGPMDGKNTTVDAHGSTKSEEPSELTMDRGSLGKVEMRRVNGAAYIKGDKAFWSDLAKNEGGSSASSDDEMLAQLMSDKWIKGSPEDLGKDSENVSMKGLVASLTSGSTDTKLTSSNTTVTHDEINGRSAYKLESTDGETTVWISDDGKYDLLKATGISSSSSRGSMTEVTFSEWDQPKTISAPAGAIEMPKNAT